MSRRFLSARVLRRFLKQPRQVTFSRTVTGPFGPIVFTASNNSKLRRHTILFNVRNQVIVRRAPGRRRPRRVFTTNIKVTFGTNVRLHVTQRHHTIRNLLRVRRLLRRRTVRQVTNLRPTRWANTAPLLTLRALRRQLGPARQVDQISLRLVRTKQVSRQ